MGIKIEWGSPVTKKLRFAMENNEKVKSDEASNYGFLRLHL